MGHDHHFLERLDRASRAEADFALSLYRDHAALRYVLEAARVPADADRVALEIAPGGPHVIVRREGQFVTCLGRGMSVGPHPVVSRARIDALFAVVADLRARRQMAKLVERPGEDEGDLFARLINRADGISREELVAVSGWQPLFAPTWYRMAFDNMAAAVKWSIERTQRGPAGDGGSREAAYARWKLVWSIGHHWLLATMGSKDYLLEHTEGLARATNLTFTTCLSSLGSTRLSMRGWWGAARIGKPLVAVYKQRLAAPNDARDLLDAMVALTTIGLRHSALRAEVQKAVLSPRTYDDDALTTSAASIAGGLKAAFDDPEAHARDFLAWGREHYRERSAHLPEGSPQRFADEGDVPDDLARSVLLGLDLNMFADDTAASLVVASVSTIAHARAEDFYLPREVESALRVPWTPERTRELLSRALRNCVKQEPVRSGPTPGRNDPCPCGSGKKHKKCCRR